jgi:hypothetical protein
MDRLSDLLGISTVSANTLQTTADVLRRAGMVLNEGSADAGAADGEGQAEALDDGDQRAPGDAALLRVSDDDGG